ncbi:MAG: YjcZ family sporulation protein, partial [Nitrososphaeraceae archaeon]
AFEWLKANGVDKEWFEEIDEQQLLAAFEWLKANGIDKELLSASDLEGGFVLILVLFILLVIIGAGFGSG